MLFAIFEGKHNTCEAVPDLLDKNDYLYAFIA